MRLCLDDAEVADLAGEPGGEAGEAFALRLRPSLLTVFSMVLERRLTRLRDSSPSLDSARPSASGEVSITFTEAEGGKGDIRGGTCAMEEEEKEYSTRRPVQRSPSEITGPPKVDVYTASY
jgi:hypothetical protein